MAIFRAPRVEPGVKKGLVLVLGLMSSLAAQAQDEPVEVPNTFKDGELANAESVNENFRVLQEAINQTDYPVVQGIVVVIAALVVVVSVAVDLLVASLDPRLRY